MMFWFACVQQWMKPWIIQGCTVDHVKHIGICESFAYVYRQIMVSLHAKLLSSMGYENVNRFFNNH